MPKLVIDVSPDGSVNIDAQGFKGNGCAKASEQIEVMLSGGGKVSKKKKPEFFAPATQGNKVGVKGF